MPSKYKLPYYIVPFIFICVIVFAIELFNWNVVYVNDINDLVNISVAIVVPEEEDVESRFLSRKQILQHRCQEVNEDKTSEYFDYFLKQRLFYQEEHEFFVCLVAKSGASTWRAHLRNIKKKSHSRRQHPSKLALKELLFANTTTKILTVRHPLERIISLFRDKYAGGYEMQTPFQNPSTTRVWYKKAERILGLNLGPEGNKSISFVQFINVVLNQKVSGDRHVRSVFSNCVPCMVKYDYILHLESFDEDLTYVFNVLNIKESPIETRRNKKDFLRKTTDDYFKELPKSLLKRIFNYLKIDFYLFNYELPKYLQEFS